MSERFALMCALSAGIATLGLLQSSVAVVIGAMLVSPMMGPIAALGFGFASIDGRRIEEAAKVIGIGAVIGILTGMVLTGISPIKNATPEILARTAPNLLDLAVALLSGLAGGYATVHRKGETAIGVAIATALMPPLATVGYSLAVFRFDFAAGATLLFLTNLAAIAFSFAIVARLRGVARPLRNVEFKPFHVVLGLGAFLLLAAPLALTLRQLAEEAYLTSLVRREVVKELSIEPSQIAQLTVTFPLVGNPDISVTAITAEYQRGAETGLRNTLRTVLGHEPDLTFRQVVAADLRAQTQAMIDAAFDANATRASRLNPPSIEALRARSRLPIMAAWTDTGSNTILLAPADLATVGLSVYRAEEGRLDVLDSGWRIAIIPPFRPDLFIPVGQEPSSDALDEEQVATVIWAIQKWGLKTVRVTSALPPTSPNAEDETQDRRITQLADRLRAAGIAVVPASGASAADVAIATGESSVPAGVSLHVLTAMELSVVSEAGATATQ